MSSNQEKKMETSAPAVPESYIDEPVETPAKQQKTAEIIQFPQNSVETEPSDYATYQALGGKLKQVDYKRTLERAWTGEAQNEMISSQVRAMEHFSKLAPLPDNVVILYGILRKSEHLDGLSSSDQHILAEALAIADETQILEQFKQSLPNIFA